MMARAPKNKKPNHQAPTQRGSRLLIGTAVSKDILSWLKDILKLT